MVTFCPFLRQEDWKGHWARKTKKHSCAPLFLSCYSHTHNSSNTRRTGFLHVKQFCDTSCVSSNSIQTWCSVVSVRSHKLGAQSQKTAPTSDANCKSQVVSCISDWLTINHSSHDQLLGFDSLLEMAHGTQGNTYLGLPVYNITRAMINDIGEPPDEEICNARSERVMCAGGSVPMELGHVTLLGGT